MENDIPRLRKLIEEAQSVPIQDKPPLNGNEIMRLLGLKSGTAVGEAVQVLRDAMDEFAGEGDVLTKDQAEGILLEHFGSTT